MCVSDKSDGVGSFVTTRYKNKMAASDKMAGSDPLVLLDQLMKSDSQESVKMIWAEKLIAESVKQTLSKE